MADWTDAMDAMLRRLADKGDSQTQTAKAISKKFDRPITASMVGSRASRLNGKCRKEHRKIKFKGAFQHRPHGTAADYLPTVKHVDHQGKLTRALGKRVDGRPAAPNLELPANLRSIETESEGVPFSQLGFGQCRWPKELLGPSGADMLCCGMTAHVEVKPSQLPGVRVIETLPYCDVHLGQSRKSSQSKPPAQEPRTPRYAPRRQAVGSSPWDL